VRARPTLLADILGDAVIMAEALDGVWTHLDSVVQGAGRSNRSAVIAQPGPTETPFLIDSARSGRLDC